MVGEPICCRYWLVPEQLLWLTGVGQLNGVHYGVLGVGGANSGSWRIHEGIGWSGEVQQGTSKSWVDNGVQPERDTLQVDRGGVRGADLERDALRDGPRVGRQGFDLERDTLRGDLGGLGWRGGFSVG